MAIIKNPLTIVQASGGGNKLPDVLNKTVTTLTAEDLIGTTQIPSYTFRNCIDLTSVEFPSILQIIGNYAFRFCDSLTSVAFADNSQLTSIGLSAFSNCSKLTSINIPSSVTIIADNVFDGCNSLTTMTILATTPPALGGTNAISSATTKIYIPAGTLSVYQSATNWSNFADLFEELPA